MGKVAESDTARRMNHDAPLRTSELILGIGNSQTGESVSLEELLEGFHHRAFGVLLLAVLLPVFIPVPFGLGAICGGLVALVGAQMMLMLEHPWLPRWISRKRMRREAIRRFGARWRPRFERLERLCAPRLQVLTEHRAAHVFSGCLLLLLGVMLALPIPLTNYPFGIVLLLFAVALIERDGALLLLAWTLAAGIVVATVLLSGELLAQLTPWLS
jgi:hypothetical protein